MPPIPDKQQPRRLPQIRVAVNARCRRACFYCRPSGEAIATHAHAEIDPSDLVLVMQGLSRLGLDHVKLTGGDPALWEPLVPTVAALKRDAGISEIHVISRHPTIAKLADGLARSGADLINLSIDTLDPSTHRKITGIDDLHGLLDAVDACVRCGVPCKVNMVVMRGINDAEVLRMVEFCEAKGIVTLKLLDMIEDLHLGTENFAPRLRVFGIRDLRDLYISLAVITDTLRARAVRARTIHQGGLGHPMLSLIMPSGLEVLIKDHHAGAWYGSMCRACPHYPCHDALMALRLTADLRLQFCLLRDDITVDLKPHLHSGALDAVLEQALGVYATATFRRVAPPVGAEAPPVVTA
jgi:GTP 3',8-cyclase